MFFKNVFLHLISVNLSLVSSWSIPLKSTLLATFKPHKWANTENNKSAVTSEYCSGDTVQTEREGRMMNFHGRTEQILFFRFQRHMPLNARPLHQPICVLWFFFFFFFFFSPSRWCPHGVFDTMQGLPHTFLSGSPDHLLSLTLISLGLYLIWGQIFLVYFLHFFFIFSRNLGYIWGLPHSVGSTAGSKFDFECVKLLEFRFVQEFVFILMMIHSVIIKKMWAIPFCIISV